MEFKFTCGIYFFTQAIISYFVEYCFYIFNFIFFKGTVLANRPSSLINNSKFFVKFLSGFFINRSLFYIFYSIILQ